MVFDEDYGKVPAFWFELDRMCQQGVGEVPATFRAWVAMCFLAEQTARLRGCAYHQRRNAAAYESRRRKASLGNQT